MISTAIISFWIPQHPFYILLSLFCWYLLIYLFSLLNMSSILDHSSISPKFTSISTLGLPQRLLFWNCFVFSHLKKIFLKFHRFFYSLYIFLLVFSFCVKWSVFKFCVEYSWSKVVAQVLNFWEVVTDLLLPVLCYVYYHISKTGFHYFFLLKLCGTLISSTKCEYSISNVTWKFVLWWIILDSVYQYCYSANQRMKRNDEKLPSVAIRVLFLVSQERNQSCMTLPQI